MSELSHEINIVNKLFEYKCQECFALVQRLQIKTLKISPDVNKAVLLNKSLEVDSRLQVNLQLILRHWVAFIQWMTTIMTEIPVSFSFF